VKSYLRLVVWLCAVTAMVTDEPTPEIAVRLLTVIAFEATCLVTLAQAVMEGDDE
jgi:hypothetical protein